METVVCIIPSSASARVHPLLQRCLISIEKARIQDITVIVVLTTTNRNPQLGSLTKHIDHIVYADNNAGFAELNNAALRWSFQHIRSQYHLFLNDDTWIDTSFFRNLKTILQNSAPDIRVPMIRDNAGGIESFGIEYFTSGYPKNADKPTIATSLAPAACLLVKTSFLKMMKKKFGFVFNPVLYYYIEDVEFSIRALAASADISKDPSLVAYHVGSFTSVPESYFTYYFSFRNILWVILMTWPARTILAHSLKIVVVYCWLLLTTQFKRKYTVPAKIVWGTARHLKQLLRLRKKILSAYPKSFRFESIFSPYMFRTRRKGVPI